MINILSSKTIFDKDYVYDVLKEYIKKDSKICVIAYSFFSDAFSQKSYEESYSKPKGIWYLHIVNPLLRYGVNEDNISFVIYGKDNKEEAKEKVDAADIIFLPGGAPDLMMERLREFDLDKVILNQKNKVIMGPSAGSMVRFNWFHISKDRDYKKYGIYDGLGLLEDFGIEVHFNKRKQQKKGLRRVSHYHKRPVYVINEDGFMVLKDKEIIYSYSAYKYYEKGKRVK